jgi:hypothetical protein
MGMIYYYDKNGFYYAAANSFMFSYIKQHGGGITPLRPPYQAVNKYKKSYFDGKRWQIIDYKAEAKKRLQRLVNYRQLQNSGAADGALAVPIAFDAGDSKISRLLAIINDPD